MTDEKESFRILYEDAYRAKWEAMREKERDDQREKRNLHRPSGFIAAKD